MIKGTSLTVSIAGTETMIVSGTVEVGQPIFVANVFYTELTTEQQEVYDAAMPIVTGSYFTTINNTGADLSIDRITDEVLSETPSEIDFETLSTEDQDKLRDLLALFVEISSEED